MLPGWAYGRLVSEAAHSDCSGTLVLWDQRLYSTVGQGCWLGSLSEVGCQMGSSLPGFSGQLPWGVGLKVTLCSWVEIKTFFSAWMGP